MPETATAPNNRVVVYRSKPEREAVPSNHETGKLPQHVKKKAKGAMKRGLISEKAARRHLGA